MKSIPTLFSEAWEKKNQRGWKKVYIMVDLHGVVLPSSYHKKNDLQFISEYAKACLQWLTKREDVCLILWSSSHIDEIECVRTWLQGFDIKFDFVNENPLEANTSYADFSKKPYFSIVLDDKAGFEAGDWYWMLQWINKFEGISPFHVLMEGGLKPGELNVFMGPPKSVHT
jgi:hypothetical protein